MDTLAGLSRRMGTVTSLSGLVNTLKVLSAVNIRHFEQAAQAASRFHQNLEEGLQITLREWPAELALPSEGLEQAVLFGSDQGLCGSFNEHLVAVAGERLPHRPPVLCVGARLGQVLEERGWPVSHLVLAPLSTASLGSVVQELLDRLEASGRVTLFYQRAQNSGLPQVQAEPLLPIDPTWLNEVRGRPWDSRCLPRCWGPPQQVLASLLQEHLLVACYRALCHSLVSENVARLATMQTAEHSLEELSVELRGVYHNLRQNAVTEELLDVVSGFEVLEQAGK